MKKKHINSKIVWFFLLFISICYTELFAQNISYSFANAQNTNDGVSDFYEVDVYLTTDTDFALGDGQFYLDYNAAAFGTNIFGNNMEPFQHPNGSGSAYVLDERIAGILNTYGTVINNSTTSKVSISWFSTNPGAASTNITVAGSPNLICHIKIKYADVNEAPMLTFDDELPISSSGLTFIDNGAQLVNDSFDSSGAVVPNNWTGVMDADWNVMGNWSSGSVPTSSDNVVISNTGNTITASADIDVNKLTLDSGAALTVEGTINNTGAVVLKSGSSLIAKNSAPFNLTYTRALGTSNWYIVSSPTLNQDIDDFAAASGLAVGTGSNLGLGTFNTATNNWEYYQSGTSNSDVFDSVTGYAINLSGTSGDVNFTGGMPVNDNFSIALLTTGGRFNLLGNPYPSFISSADILTNNTTSIETQTIWVWDQSANGGLGTYEVKVTIDDFKIAPGQGFFVQSDNDGGNFVISENEQNHQTTDTFSRNEDSTRSEVHLSVTDGNLVSNTKIYYIDGATTGFDNGYDGPLFGGSDNSFSIYTQLVSDNIGINYSLQSLPASNYESMVIPLGLNATLGMEVTFSATSIDIPNGLSVILEDTVTGVFTELNEPENQYQVQLDTDTDGIGRFYLHLNTLATLSTESSTYQNIRIYTTSDRILKISGLREGLNSLKVYSILGQEVLSTSFEETATTKDIQLPANLIAGVYIVTIETSIGIIQKKIVLE